MADNFAQLVKSQADIVRIVGEYIKLRKAGANWTALCPFHKEKSGSFHLYATQGNYYCFGCHEHGDVFSFVMKMDNISFPEAVRAVAVKTGIPLPKKEFNSPQEAQEAGLRRQLIDVHEAATQYFQQALNTPEAARAREYMTARGITAETIAKFRLGYAPDNFNEMRERLGKQFSDEVLRVSGLFSWKEQEDGSAGQMYARFRKRITFPIANEQGKVIAFTARALDSAEQDAKAGPKYMNSPETALYTKGQVLFNLDKAKAAIKAKDAALLVEGQMDCISLFMAGVDNVIATSGTAFTETQVRMLGRFTKRVWLNFDPDAAGMNAAEKTLSLLVEEGFEVKVITLEGGLDPDRYVREHGVKAYAEAVKGAARYADFLIERARKEFGTRTPEAKVKALNFLLPHIRRVPNPIARNDFAENAAQKLGIENALMRQELKRAAQQRLESVTSTQSAAVTETEATLLLALLLPEADSSRALAAEQLGSHPEWYAELPTATLIEALVNSPAPENPFDAAPDDLSRSQLANAMKVGKESTAAVVQNALDTIRRQDFDRRTRDLTKQIGEAQMRGDDQMRLKLLKEMFQLGRERLR